MILGLISDAHGHTAALKRGIEVLRRSGAEELIFLGDAVGYIPDPETVRIVLSEGLTVLSGNHENMMLNSHPAADLQLVYRHNETLEQLDDALVSAIQKWPSYLLLNRGGVSVEAFHGSPVDHICGYVYPDTKLSGFETSAPIVVMGHTHRPFIRRLNETLFINAGSCGLPRDTGGFGSVASLDTKSNAARILRFDISDLAENVIAKHSLHPSVVDALRRKPAGEFKGTIVDV
jgi:putative phosphoesterase